MGNTIMASPTKTGIAWLAAGFLSSRRQAAIAADYLTWINAQDTEVTALDALMMAAQSSKSPRRVLQAADVHYAAIESDPPQLLSITPNTGAAAGGTAVTITGKDLTGASVRTLGGVALTSVVVVNDTTITGVTGAHSAGAVSGVVTTPAGTDTETNFYTYV